MAPVVRDPIVIHPVPTGDANKQVRFKLGCGHSRAMPSGTKRLTIRGKQALLTQYRRRKIWCYDCGGYQVPTMLMGVEVVK